MARVTDRHLLILKKRPDKIIRTLFFLEVLPQDSEIKEKYSPLNDSLTDLHQCPLYFNTCLDDILR